MFIGTVYYVYTSFPRKRESSLINELMLRTGVRTYPLAPFLRGRGNQGSPLRVGEGSGEGSKRHREAEISHTCVTSVNEVGLL